MHRTTTTRLCFVATVLLGLGLLLFGLVLIPAMPYFQLDVVLTQDELKDRHLRDSTLAILKKASANQWFVVTFSGLAQLVIGVIGLLSISQSIDQETSIHE